MTLSDIKALDRDWLNASEVAAVLGTDGQGIRTWAHECPEKLGFPVVITGRKGRRVKIPKAGFLAYMEGV